MQYYTVVSAKRSSRYGLVNTRKVKVDEWLVQVIIKLFIGSRVSVNGIESKEFAINVGVYQRYGTESLSTR